MSCSYLPLLGDVEALPPSDALGRSSSHRSSGVINRTGTILHVNLPKGSMPDVPPEKPGKSDVSRTR